MSDVRWIKLATDVFDNRKIRQIERMPDGDALIIIWFKMLILAGNVNDNGMVYFTKDIPYTEQLLANEFNRPLATVQMALQVFQQFGMIDIVDEIIHVTNWERYQNIEGMERLKAQNRERQKRFYDKHKLELPKPNVSLTLDLTQPNATDKIREDKNRLEDRKIEVQPSDCLSVEKSVENFLSYSDFYQRYKAAAIDHNYDLAMELRQKAIEQGLIKEGQVIAIVN